MVGRTKRATKAEQSRFERIVALGCIACRKRVGILEQCGVTEADHLLSGGVRIGHSASIPLGVYHHRGIPKAGMTTKDMERIYGPSRRLASKRFHLEFGSDLELLAQVNDLIKVNS